MYSVLMCKIIFTICCKTSFRKWRKKHNSCNSFPKVYDLFSISFQTSKTISQSVSLDFCRLKWFFRSHLIWSCLQICDFREWQLQISWSDNDHSQKRERERERKGEMIIVLFIHQTTCSAAICSPLLTISGVNQNNNRVWSLSHLCLPAVFSFGFNRSAETFFCRLFSKV